MRLTPKFQITIKDRTTYETKEEAQRVARLYKWMFHRFNQGLKIQVLYRRTHEGQPAMGVFVLFVRARSLNKRGLFQNPKIAPKSD